MPLFAYVGLQRSGKSYEVVKNVILPALRQGRRVVSNIAGLNYDEFKSILYSEGLSDDRIGQLVQVSHDEVNDPFFFRTDKDEEQGINSFIQAGDLVALDEIWRFWKKRGEIHPRAMNFMRMHGHMTDAKTGLICEIALITQSIRDINENIRDVVQETYQTVKNTKLGSNTSYIVHVFQRGSTTKADLIRTLAPRKYEARYFPLYKSHSQHHDGDAKPSEENPDDRGNLLKGALFKFGLPFALIAFIVGGYLLKRVFNPPVPVTEAAASVADSQIPASSAVLPSAIVRAGRPADSSGTRWRVSGYFYKGGTVTFLIVGEDGAVRQLVNPPNFQFIGSGASVQLPEGGFATTWTVLNKQQRGAL